MSSIFGEYLAFPQERGDQVQLKVHGDEFYARYEDQEGYTVVYDSDMGRYCYAHLIAGEFVSSGIDISKSPPPELRRHLRESEAVRNRKFNARYARMTPQASAFLPSASLKTFGAVKGLLEGRRLAEGEVLGLTVMVDFKDVKSEVTAKEVEALLNSEDYHENGNFCSVREYFRLMSAGKLDYSNHVAGPVTLSKSRQYYTEKLLVKEAMDLAVKGGLDLHRFDSEKEGIVDALSFLYAGQTQYQGELWPHNHFLELSYGDISTYFYMLSSLGRSGQDLTIGTFCHESGHMLCRWPDLYDYGNRDGDFEKSAGLGCFCLMSAGNHNDEGRTPSPVCAFLRDLVGWCDRRVLLNHPGRYEADHGDYSAVLVYETDKINEYFLVENRSALDLDACLPAAGMAVYHCDTLGSNEWQGGSATSHYQCGLLQADGSFDLETNRDLGGKGDLFAKAVGVALSHATKPSSLLWDGSDSGLIISDISEPGRIISFLAGEGPGEARVRGSSASGGVIPDNSPQGLSSAISIDPEGRAKRLRVEVDISHRNVSNLKIELFSPQGKRATLHNRTGIGQRDLHRTYDSLRKASLAAFLGQHLRGEWTLKIVDMASPDEGRLNGWSIEICY
ncbi:MAG TPA: M6 family metalloprotease domain-containing protein [Methanothrix sp.]|nr:M6 family metalloprotease domain-containing protein [Methanothrix sp.]HPT18459.1 M6 family metalloprotease domain-containing protein [Methanothrix sp.]